jgi:metal-dependent amidase/aminoacylase/carboxypeptidase family protein
MGATELPRDARSEWTGTIIVLFQPNEEHTGGAQAMVDDGLYDKIRKPDFVMAQHLMQIPSGSVSVRIRIYSSEGHSTNPQVAIDVTVVASRIILQLQDLVCRVGRESYASINAEEIHAGQPGTDWVSHADIVLDVKAYDLMVRLRLLDGIKEIVGREAAASGADRAPEVTSSVRVPLSKNDVGLTEQVGGVFSEFFGLERVFDDVPRHPCEDFSILATVADAPYLFWFIDRVDPRHSIGRAKMTRFSTRSLSNTLLSTLLSYIQH